MRLSGHGISAALPQGWEGAIVRQRPLDLTGTGVYSLTAQGPAAPAVVQPLPVVHLANFALPPQRGDFGSGAVETMGADAVFLSLLEYGPENVGTALFAPDGVPRNLRPDDLDPHALQRTLPGQAGHQRFFTTAGRAFCLYVVIGDRTRAATSITAANDVLATLEIGPP